MLRQSKPKVVLSLTPLIDVVFILLIFFMLASQFSDWRNIDLLPHVQMSDAGSDEAISSLRLLNNGSFELDGEKIVELQIVIENLLSLGRGRVVFLSPEGTVEVQRVVDVIEALNNSGLTKIQLVENRGEET